MNGNEERRGEERRRPMRPAPQKPFLFLESKMSKMMRDDAKVMKSIETAMAPADKKPYYSAASYYYDNNKDMKQALEWIDKAVELNPKAYWVWHLKAKIQLKLKDAKGAIETAEKSKALALEDKDDAYVKNNDKLIAEAKGMKQLIDDLCYE